MSNRGSRLALAAAAAAALAWTQTGRAEDTSTGQAVPVEAPAVNDAQSLIRQWPAASQKGAQAMIEKYGQPEAATERMLVWLNKTPWDSIIVHRDPYKHGFPISHEDFLEQTIRYRVPQEKVVDLLSFSEGLVVDLTRGTLSSHCDSEKANILAMNLANEVATGKRGVDSARNFLRDTLREVMAGKSSPYAESLLFGAGRGEPGSTETP